MRAQIVLGAGLLISLTFVVSSTEPPVLPNSDKFDKIAFKGKPVAPCVACRKLVTSFLDAVAETDRQGFAGGDADWEKQKLGSYENSELRFIEIQERVCIDVGLGKDQCFNLAEVHESYLEDWFFNKRKKNVDLYESLCIYTLKVCCPKNTYGANCIPCPGGIESPCGGNGKCMKGGTREENATCFCDAGYTGELCGECDKGYYEVVDSPKFTCKICDRACRRRCRGPGPKNCEVCAFGFRFVPGEGCVEHFDDYRNKVKMSEEPRELESKTDSKEPNETKHLDIPDETNENSEPQFKLDSNLEDSTTESESHPEHSEL